jgi:hypothetical protein
MSMFNLAPGQTTTVEQFLPVSYTGKMTLQSGFNVTGASPPNGLYPSMSMSVAAETPSDRQITLQQEGTQVKINAPRAALGHLYYLDAIMTCASSDGGTSEEEVGGWAPISGTILHEPKRCDGGIGPKVISWTYLVTAPGYTIASGQMGTCTTWFCINTLVP